MAESKPVTIRIPEPWLSQIEAIAAKKYPGRKGNPNKSQVVLDAVDFYLQHLNDNNDSVTVNDNVLTVSNSSIEEVANRAVKNEIEKLTQNLKQALSQCMTEFTAAKPEQVNEIFKSCLTISQSKKKDSAKAIEQSPLPSAIAKRKTQIEAKPTQNKTESDKQELDERRLTRHQMYEYLNIAPRTLDIWIKKAKAKSDPPIISHEGKSWRYISSGEGLKKVFILIED